MNEYLCQDIPTKEKNSTKNEQYIKDSIANVGKLRGKNEVKTSFRCRENSYEWKNILTGQSSILQKQFTLLGTLLLALFGGFLYFFTKK